MANKGVQGIVIGKSEHNVRIRIFRNNTCENCDCVLQDACDPDAPPTGRRGMFDLFADRSALELEARNTVSAEVGDRIVVKIKRESSLVKGAFLVYLMPGLLFLVGLALGGWMAETFWGWGGDEVILAQLGGGVLMLVSSYLFTKVLLLIKGTGEYLPEVAQVVRRAEADRAIYPA